MKNSKYAFNFEKLKVYHKIIDFVDFAYGLSSKFPQSKIFNLISQFNRATTSMALNLGEGSSGTKKEFVNYIGISYKSLNECIVCCTIAQRRN